MSTKTHDNLSLVLAMLLAILLLVTGCMPCPKYEWVYNDWTKNPPKPVYRCVR